MTVVELIDSAKDKGLDMLSITDHDTTEGQPEAVQYGIKKKLAIVTGIEISAADPETGKKVHILGYGFLCSGTNIESLCRPLIERRHRNTIRQIAVLRNYGIQITEKEVRDEAGAARWLYKQHIMAVLVRKGFTDAIYSPLYRTLFKGDGPAAGDIEYIHYADAVSAIKADGGLAVLAHPGQLDSFYLIRRLVELGLDGIEINHPDNSRYDKARILNAAEIYGLDLSGGSDFHGSYGSSVELGEITAPKQCLESFREIINRI